MSDPGYPAFPVLSFIAFVLVLVPLPWHLQAWNSGTCLFMIWTALGCLNLFINSIVWHDNAIDWAPIWCDISSRIIVAAAVAIPAATLCINRRLYIIAACQTASITRAQKRKDVLIDLFIGIGIPAIQLPLQFIVEGHRYDIIEDVGCYPTTYNTWPAYPLTYVWPNAIGLVSAIYCILTLREFMKRRAQFSHFLSSNSSITVNRYFRLMALATIEIIVTMPVNAYGLYLNIHRGEIHPWISWSDTHFDWFSVDQVPALVWRSNREQAVTIELSRWFMVAGALVFFAFFGFASEARKHYYKAYLAIATRLGFKKSLKAPGPWGSFKSVKGDPAVLPISAPSGSLTSTAVHVPHPPPYPGTWVSSTSSSGEASFRKSDYTVSTSYTATPDTPDFKEYQFMPPTPSSSSSSTRSIQAARDIKEPMPSP